MRERDTHPEGGEERRDKPLEHGQGNSKKGRKRKKKAKEKGEEEENSGGVREERQAYEEDGEDNAVVMAENLNEKDVRGGGKKEGSVPRTVLHGEAFSSQRSASSSYSTIKSIPASDVPHVGGVTASSSGRIVEEREERTGHGKNGGSDTAQAKATKTPPSSSSSTASPIAAPHMRAKKIPHHSRKQVSLAEVALRHFRTREMQEIAVAALSSTTSNTSIITLPSRSSPSSSQHPSPRAKADSLPTTSAAATTTSQSTRKNNDNTSLSRTATSSALASCGTSARPAKLSRRRRHRRAGTGLHHCSSFMSAGGRSTGARSIGGHSLGGGRRGHGRGASGGCDSDFGHLNSSGVITIGGEGGHRGVGNQRAGVTDGRGGIGTAEAGESEAPTRLTHSSGGLSTSSSASLFAGNSSTAQQEGSEGRETVRYRDDSKVENPLFTGDILGRQRVDSGVRDQDHRTVRAGLERDSVHQMSLGRHETSTLSVFDEDTAAHSQLLEKRTHRSSDQSRSPRPSQRQSPVRENDEQERDKGDDGEEENWDAEFGFGSGGSMSDAEGGKGKGGGRGSRGGSGESLNLDRVGGCDREHGSASPDSWYIRRHKRSGGGGAPGFQGLFRKKGTNTGTDSGMPDLDLDFDMDDEEDEELSVDEAVGVGIRKGFLPAKLFDVKPESSQKAVIGLPMSKTENYSSPGALSNPKRPQSSDEKARRPGKTESQEIGSEGRKLRKDSNVTNESDTKHRGRGNSARSLSTETANTAATVKVLKGGSVGSGGGNSWQDTISASVQDKEELCHETGMDSLKKGEHIQRSERGANRTRGGQRHRRGRSRYLHDEKPDTSEQEDMTAHSSVMATHALGGHVVLPKDQSRSKLSHVHSRQSRSDSSPSASVRSQANPSKSKSESLKRTKSSTPVVDSNTSRRREVHRREESDNEDNDDGSGEDRDESPAALPQSYHQAPTPMCDAFIVGDMVYNEVKQRWDKITRGRAARLGLSSGSGSGSSGAGAALTSISSSSGSGSAEGGGYDSGESFMEAFDVDYDSDEHDDWLNSERGESERGKAAGGEESDEDQGEEHIHLEKVEAEVQEVDDETVEAKGSRRKRQRGGRKGLVRSKSETYANRRLEGEALMAEAVSAATQNIGMSNNGLEGLAHRSRFSSHRELMGLAADENFSGVMTWDGAEGSIGRDGERDVNRGRRGLGRNRERVSLSLSEDEGRGRADGRLTEPSGLLLLSRKHKLSIVDELKRRGKSSALLSFRSRSAMSGEFTGVARRRDGSVDPRLFHLSPAMKRLFERSERSHRELVGARACSRWIREMRAAEDARKRMWQATEADVLYVDPKAQTKVSEGRPRASTSLMDSPGPRAGGLKTSSRSRSSEGFLSYGSGNEPTRFEGKTLKEDRLADVRNRSATKIVYRTEEMYPRQRPTRREQQPQRNVSDVEEGQGEGEGSLKVEVRPRFELGYYYTGRRRTNRDGKGGGGGGGADGLRGYDVDDHGMRCRFAKEYVERALRQERRKQREEGEGEEQQEGRRAQEERDKGTKGEGRGKDDSNTSPPPLRKRISRLSSEGRKAEAFQNAMSVLDMLSKRRGSRKKRKKKKTASTTKTTTNTTRKNRSNGKKRRSREKKRSGR